MSGARRAHAKTGASDALLADVVQHDTWRERSQGSSLAWTSARSPQGIAGPQRLTQERAVLQPKPSGNADYVVRELCVVAVSGRPCPHEVAEECEPEAVQARRHQCRRDGIPDSRAGAEPEEQRDG